MSPGPSRLPQPGGEPVVDGARSPTLGRAEFAWRSAVVIGLTLGAVGLSLAIWRTLDGLVMLFAAMLLAVFLRGLADMVAARSRLSPGIALAVVCVLLTGTGVATVRLIAPPALRQASELADRLPIVVADLRDQVAATTWGGEWLGIPETPLAPHANSEADDEVGELIEQAGSARVIRFLSNVAGQVAAVVFAVLVIIPSGLFFAAQPGLYFDGVLGLLPRSIRPRAREISQEIVQRLGWWLIGQAALAGMLGLITGLALWALGLPLALILALLRGGLNVIPNVGPVVAVIPALLIGAGLGGDTFLQVAVVYTIIQIVDNNILAPWINQRTVRMAPMVLIGGQLLLGLMMGITGVIVAAPLIVVVMVLVQRLYVEGLLGEPTGPRGAQALPTRPEPEADGVLAAPAETG